MSNIETTNSSIQRYNLSPEQLTTEQERLLSDIRAINSEPDVYCVWVNADSPYADIVRTYETQYWGFMPEIMAGKEKSSEFLLVVDTRDPDLTEVKRVSRIALPYTNPQVSGRTGMTIVDDVLDSNQALTLETFLQYYNERGVDISRCFSVETNIRVKRSDRYKGLPLAEIGYLAMFQRIDTLRQNNLSYIFASINQDSIDSFKLIDLRVEPLAGRDELRTPGQDGKFIDDFRTVAIPTTKHNLNIFRQIESLSAPVIYVD